MTAIDAWKKCNALGRERIAMIVDYNARTAEDTLAEYERLGRRDEHYKLLIETKGCWRALHVFIKEAEAK